MFMKGLQIEEIPLHRIGSFYSYINYTDAKHFIILFASTCSRYGHECHIRRMVHIVEFPSVGDEQSFLVVVLLHCCHCNYL